MDLLHASVALQRAEAYYVPRTHYHEPRKHHFRLPPNIRSIPYLSREPDREVNRTASYQGVTRLTLPHFGPYPALFLPASSCPQPSSTPRPWPSPLQNRISPKPTALRKNRDGAAAGERGRPWPGARHSHHRGRWLGRKAEVRKWPGPRRLPFREKRSRSLRPDFRTLPSVLRVGEGSLAKLSPL